MLMFMRKQRGPRKTASTRGSYGDVYDLTRQNSPKQRGPPGEKYMRAQAPVLSFTFTLAETQLKPTRVLAGSDACA